MIQHVPAAVPALASLTFHPPAKLTAVRSASLHPPTPHPPVFLRDAMAWHISLHPTSNSAPVVAMPEFGYGDRTPAYCMGLFMTRSTLHLVPHSPPAASPLAVYSRMRNVCCALKTPLSLGLATYRLEFGHRRMCCPITCCRTRPLPSSIYRSSVY